MSDPQIEVVVSADASGARGEINSIGVAAERTAAKVSQETNKAGAAIDSIGKNAAKSASEFSKSEGSIVASIKRATTQLENLNKTASQKLEMRISTQGLDAAKFEPMLARLRELEAAQNRVVGSSRGFASGLQNTSYQLQDFVVQVNGGTDATRALAMQLPQMLVGFGAAGAAIGVVAALLPNLIGLFSDSASESGKLSDAMSDFDKAIGNVGQTIKQFDMEKLYEQFNGSSAAVRAATLEQIKFQQEFIKTTQLVAGKKFGESLGGLGEFGTMDRLAGAFASSGSENLAKQLGVSFETAKDLMPVLAGLRDGTQDVNLAFTQFGTALLGGNAKAVELATSMAELAKSDRDAAAAQSTLSEAQDKMAKGHVLTKKEAEAAAKANKLLAKESESLEAILNRINGKDAGFDANYVQTVNKLLLAYDKGRLSLNGFNEAFAAYVAMQPGAKKEAAELAKANEDYAKALSAGDDALVKQAEKLEQEVEFYGQTETAINNTIIARLEEARAIADANGAYPEHLAYLDREIEARKRIAAASANKDILDANKKAVEQNAKAWEKFSDDIERSLTDSLYRSFEAGGNFGKTFADTLKNSLKTIGIKFAVQMLVQPVTTGLAGMFGGNGQQRGENGELLGYAKQGYDILNMGNTISKAGSMVGNGISYVGNATGSAAMSGFGAGFSSGVGEAMLGNAFVGPSASLAGNSSIAAGSNAGSFLSSYGGYLAAGLQLLQGDVKGAAWTAAGTAVGSVFGPVGAGIGAVVGSLLGGIFGGGGEQYKRQVTSSYGEYTNGKFSDYGADPNYFPSSKRLGESTDDALAMVNKQYSQTLGALFKAFDIDEQIKTSSGFRLRRTSGKWIGGMTATVGDKQFIASGVEGGGDAQGLDTVLADFAEKALSSGIVAAIKDSKLPDEIENLFDLSMNADGVNKTIQSVIVMQGALKAAGSSLVEFAQSFKPEDYAIGMETIAETTSRLALRLLSVNDVFSDLNLQAFALTGAGGNLASTLVDLMGGVEGFTSATTGYYENYFSQEERMDDLRRRATESLAQVGLALPESREAFRALVESLDLTTDSGQSSFAALMKVQGAFAQLTDAARESSRDLRALNARSALDEARAALERSVDAEKDRITADAESRVSALQAGIDGSMQAIDAARKSVSTLTSIFSAIENGVRRLRATGDTAGTMLQARAYIDMSLALSKSGVAPDQEKLSDAISTVASDTSRAYASIAEFEYAQLVQASKLDALGSEIGKQKSVADMQLEALEGANRFAEEQIRAIEKSASNQIAALDSLLTQFRGQIDALNGINTSVLSVRDAVAGMNTAIGGLASALNKPAPTPVSAPTSSGSSAVSGSASSSSASSSGGYSLVGNTLHFPGGGSHSISSGSVAEAQGLLISTYGLVAAGNGTYVRTRAGGGYTPPGLTLVGEEGPELVNFKQPGMVYTAAQTRNLMGGADSAIAAELRALREVNARLEARLAAIEKNTRDTHDLTYRVTEGGNVMRTVAA